MANSSNGWPVLAADSKRLRSWKLPGVDRKLKLRDGSAGFLLTHLALWFDEDLERLDVGTYDDWAYASRPIRGSTVISNHASGTAIDLNATQHPMGVATSKTFSKSEIDKIHKRLAFYQGCIRWGGDYQNRPDGMHFELNKSMGPVEKRARELMGTPRGKRILEANPGARAVILS